MVLFSPSEEFDTISLGVVVSLFFTVFVFRCP